MNWFKAKGVLGDIDGLIQQDIVLNFLFHGVKAKKLSQYDSKTLSGYDEKMIKSGELLNTEENARKIKEQIDELLKMYDELIRLINRARREADNKYKQISYPINADTADEALRIIRRKYIPLVREKERGIKRFRKEVINSVKCF